MYVYHGVPRILQATRGRVNGNPLIGKTIRHRRQCKSLSSSETSTSGSPPQPPTAPPPSPPPQESSSMFATALAWYSKKLDTHPLLTKGLTSGMIAGTGDFICQCLIDKPEKEKARAAAQSDDTAQSDVVAESTVSPFWWWDYMRTSRFCTLGALYIGPGCHYWYGALASWYPIATSATTATSAATSAASVLRMVSLRVAWDQAVFTPIFLVGWMTSLWTLEAYQQPQQQQPPVTMDASTNHPVVDSIPTRLMQSVPNILVANWMLWIPFQFANFHWVPTKFQVLTSNCLSLVWNIYLSFSTRSK